MEGTKDLISVGDLAGHTLHLHSMSGDEMLGGHLAGLFEYRLEVASTQPDIKAKDVLGEKLTIKVLLPDDQVRYFNGYVTSWTYAGLRHDRAIYHLVLRPWLWLLNFTSDCRVFNKKSALGIVERIFGKYKSLGTDFDKSRLVSEYPDYEYLVQYRESDFNLVRRLLQQEGIYFFFQHEAEKHTLVLADGVTAHEPAPGYEKIPYMPPTTTAKEMAPHFDRCTLNQGIRTKAFAQLDYNFKQAKAHMLALSEVAQDEPRYSRGEIFDYPGRYPDQGRGKALAAVRLEELNESRQSVEVQGNPLGLGVGNLVTLLSPPAGVDRTEFLVTVAHYELKVPDEHSGGAQAATEPYRATYTLQPKTDQFRPAQVATKPAILGPQTAVVVGKKKTADPDPEEIETDPYGRVRVRFHWERIGDQHPDSRGEKDGESTEEEDDTCYVRVAQLWAGNKWGAIYIPRIGHEVVVEFLEGDPDRPIITGSVYNNVNMPPYDLPKHMTQSGIKSRSTKNGTANNFNEIRFEDLKGKEELHIQAEKDMSTLVKHNQSTSVGADRSVSVGGNHTVTVSGTQTTTVTKKETQTYKAEREMKVTGTNLDEITGAHTGKYHAGRTETVENGDGLEVMESNKTVTVHGEYNSVADKQYQVVQGNNILFMKGSDVLVNNSACEVQLSGNETTVTAPSAVVIKCGAASISMKSDGSIEITGKNVKVGNSTNNAAFEPAGTTINGVKITSAAVGMHEITGGLIKVG